MAVGYDMLVRMRAVIQDGAQPSFSVVFVPMTMAHCAPPPILVLLNLARNEGANASEGSFREKPLKNVRLAVVGLKPYTFITMTSRMDALSSALEQPMGLEDMHNGTIERAASDAPPAKRARSSPSRAAPLPKLPRDGKLLVLDIDGCMTDQDYARRCHATYIRKHMEDYLVPMPEKDLLRMIRRMERQMPPHVWDEIQSEMQRLRGMCGFGPGGSDAVLVVQTCVRYLHQHGIRTEELLSIEGAVWKAGRRRSSTSPNNINTEMGGLEGHIYPDFIPLLRICRTMGISVCLYAESSVMEQMQMMRLSSQGDLGSFISGYFDTAATTTDGHNASVGSKTEPNSYLAIAQRMNTDIKDLVVLSVNEKELKAAKAAGAHAILRLRPADWSNVKDTNGSFPACCSMMQLFGSESR